MPAVGLGGRDRRLAMAAGLVLGACLGSAWAGEPSPAERAIAAARRAVEKNPSRADGYTALGMALARRARETADSRYYEQAHEAAQWMLDMGRSNVPSLTRAAYLREIFGDIDGAAELMVASLGKLDPLEVEDRAWVLTHLAHLHLLRGQLKSAEQALNEALRLFPGYHYALFQMSKLTNHARPA